MMNPYINDLVERYPKLDSAKKTINDALTKLIATFESGNKLLLCGNGGSASDAEHIAGELLKSFGLSRRLSGDEQQKFVDSFGDDGKFLASKLEYALPAINLNSHPGFVSAYGNDSEAVLSYSQMLYAIGVPGDTLLGISCSGNAKNVYYAFMTARLKGITTILLTGSRPGRCAALADCIISVPEEEIFKIQEYHLPVYHAICLAVEAHFYGQ